MKIKLAKIIEDLGLEQKESRIYLAALELGGGSVVEIARKANVERVNTYSILDGMVKKGLVSVSEKKRGKKYLAISPESLKDIAKSRLEAFERAMPSLIAIENSLEKKPKIRYYEGIDGLKQAYSETLREKASEILVIAPGTEVYEYMGEEWVKSYLVKRIKKGITVRGIAPVSKYSVMHQQNDRHELRESRLVPADDYEFNNEINIFQDKVLIVSYRDQMAVVIESRDVAKTQRALFKLAWLGADKVKGENGKEKDEETPEKVQRVTQKVLFEREGKILMMKDTKDQWELPGGTIDFGEDADVALKRELKEEMGLEPEHYNVGQTIGNFKIVREFPDKHYHYLALVYRGELKVNDFQLSEEHIESNWFSIPEILELDMVEGYNEFFANIEL